MSTSRSSTQNLAHLNGLDEHKFVISMDLAKAIEENKNKISEIDEKIKNTETEISNISKTMRDIPNEQKQSAKERIKTKGSFKNQLIEQKDALSRNIDGPEGLRVKLARQSNEDALKGKYTKFVDFMIDDALRIEQLIKKFRNGVKNYPDIHYYSDCADSLAKRYILENKSGRIIENLATKTSFTDRNSQSVNDVLRNPDLLNIIKSYLPPADEFPKKSKKKVGKTNHKRMKKTVHKKTRTNHKRK